MSKARLILTAGVAVYLLSGCAYEWGRNHRAMIGGYNDVAVPVFNNRTREAGIEAEFTTYFIEEVQQGGLAKVKSKDNSQIVVEGRIDSISFRSGSKVKNDDPGYEDLPDGVVLAKEYRVIAHVTLDVRRRSDQKVVWSGGFSGERRYAAPQVTEDDVRTVNAVYNHTARRNTLRILARELMAEAYDRMTENF